MKQSVPKRAIGAVTSWYSGGTPNRARQDYWNGDIPWVTAFTLKDPEISTSNQFLTPSAVAAGSKMAPTGSTLLLVRGSALHKEIRAGMVVAPVAFNQDVKALAPKRGLVPKYLTHVIRGNESKLLKLVTSAGNTAGVLDTKVVQSFEIFFPSESEQRDLVAAFDDVDRFIVSLERLISKKEAIKQGMMQQLLTGKTRLPGFDREWRTDTIRGIVETPVTDGPHLTPQFHHSGVPFLSVNNLVKGKIDWSDVRYISRSDHREFSRKCAPRRDDILLGKAASVGKVAIVESDITFNIWSPLAMIRVTKAVCPKFVYFQMQSASVLNQIQLLTNTSSQGNIGMGDIEKLRLPIPPLDEQVAIADVLSTVDAEVDGLRGRLNKAQMFKQGMMQELLSGRRRLHPSEAA